jgi:hypothetical protein
MAHVQETDSGSYQMTGSTKWTLTGDASTLDVVLLRGSRIQKSENGPYSITGYSPTALPAGWSSVSKLAYKGGSDASLFPQVSANFSADSIEIPSSAIVMRV